MALVFGVRPAPRPRSSRSHFLALQRAAVVAAAGLTVWAALLCSSSFPPEERETQALPIQVPAWTITKSPGSVRAVATGSSCENLLLF